MLNFFMAITIKVKGAPAKWALYQFPRIKISYARYRKLFRSKQIQMGKLIKLFHSARDEKNTHP